MSRAALLSCLVAILPLHPAHSASQHVDVSVETVVPVFQGDVKRPYVVVGQIKDNLRKPFAFLPNPTAAKKYWRRFGSAQRRWALMLLLTLALVKT